MITETARQNLVCTLILTTTSAFVLDYPRRRCVQGYVACNFNCLLIETEGLFKVIISHVHCKCSNISETVQDRVVVTTVQTT